MVREKRYEILGQPVAWRRTGVKFSSRTIYDTQKSDKLVIGIELQKQHNDEPLFYGPIFLELDFYFALPKTKQKNPPKYYSLKPDFDNLEKLYCDQLRSVCIYDDSQIVRCTTTKWYATKDEQPRVVIKITEVK